MVDDDGREHLPRQGVVAGAWLGVHQRDLPGYFQIDARQTLHWLTQESHQCLVFGAADDASVGHASCNAPFFLKKVSQSQGAAYSIGVGIVVRQDQDVTGARACAQEQLQALLGHVFLRTSLLLGLNRALLARCADPYLPARVG